MSRSIINKHYDSASSLSLSSFVSDENKRKGEVIIVNDAQHPGIYTVDTRGNIVNLSAQIDVDIETLKELIESLIVDVTKQEVLEQSEYQYKIDNNLIDDECMYYVYEDEGGGGEDEFVPHVIDGTETLEIDEDGVTGEVATINGTVEGETLVINGGVGPQPTPSEDEGEIDGESLIYDDSDLVVGEMLVTSSSVVGETMTI